MTRKIRTLTALTLAAVLFASACIPVSFQPHELDSDVVGRTYPVGKTYDWLWLGIHPETAVALFNSTGSGVTDVRVCFPHTTWPRLFYVGDNLGQPQFNSTTNAGCTLWQQLATANVGLSWKRFIGIGAGETFTVQMRLSFNGSNEVVTTGIAARTATADQSTVWYVWE